MASYQIKKSTISACTRRTDKIKMAKYYVFTACSRYEAVYYVPSIKELFSSTLWFCYSRYSNYNLVSFPVLCLAVSLVVRHRYFACLLVLLVALFHVELCLSVACFLVFYFLSLSLVSTFVVLLL